MKYRIKNTKTTVRVIGIYQIVGGIIGIGIIALLMLKTPEINGPFLFYITLALFLFAFSIQSGNLLLQESKLNKGLIFSLILQGLQIVSIGLGSYSYGFYSGANVTFGFESGGDFKFGFGVVSSGFNIKINSGESEYFFKLNFLAIFILYILIDIYKERKKINLEPTSSNYDDPGLLDENVTSSVLNK